MDMLAAMWDVHFVQGQAQGLMFMPSNIVGVRLDDDTQNRLKALGKLRDRSAHHLMKEAIAQYLAGEEMIEAEKNLTAGRYEAYELTGEFISHVDMKDWASDLGGKATKQ